MTIDIKQYKHDNKADKNSTHSCLKWLYIKNSWKSTILVQISSSNREILSAAAMLDFQD